MMSTGRRTPAIILALMLGTGGAVAQKVESVPVDLAVTYDALHANTIIAQNFWMQGGAVELGERFYRGLGVAERVEGQHRGTNTATGEPLSLMVEVFGPRYRVETRGGRYSIFGEALAGEANGFDSLFSKGSGPISSVSAGTASSANGLAVETGGGLDIRLNHRLAIRAIRASYLRTQLSNTTTNVQNSFNVGAGLVLRFGF